MKNDDPLNTIFIKQSNGKLSDEINDIKNISNFFKFIKDDKINNDTKIKSSMNFKRRFNQIVLMPNFFRDTKINQYIFIFLIYILKKILRIN
jgi:hypothetical protein